MASIIVVEDDESLGSTLSTALIREGHVVFLERSKSTALTRVSSPENFDLALIDIGLPDGSGLDLARELRAISADTGIVMLSAMTSAEFRLEAFENGADDYVPKPFHLKELLLRINKVLESKGRENITSLHGLKLNHATRQIEFDDGCKVFLAERDFQLLEFLINQSPRAISREELLEKFWQGDLQQSGRTIDNAIVRIRQALGVLENSIRAVRGVGYQWVGE